MNALEYAITAVAVIGFTPITIVAIGSALNASKRRRRDEMLDRFWSRL